MSVKEIIATVTVSIAGAGLPAFDQIAVGAHRQECNKRCKDEPMIPTPSMFHGQVSITGQEG